MFVTLVAVLCNTLVGPPLCREEVVAGEAEALTLQSCQIQGQIGISQWMAASPDYRTNWRIERYKCVIGPYQPRTRT